MDVAASPIFIIGSGRSGTTLLRNMLNAHPRIHIAFEPHFYWYESLFRRKASGHEFLDYYFQTPHFRWQRLDPASVLDELRPVLARADLGQAFVAMLRAKAAQYGRVRFGDKTPANTGCLPRIFRDFPAARAIHIVRDPRGTALSLSRMPWAPGSLMLNASYIDIERKQVARFRDRMLRVRLEDLLAEPRRTMEQVLDFVGEPWDEAVLDHARHLPDKDDTPPYPWLEGAGRDRGAPVARWEKLSPVDVRMVEYLTRRMMAECGYERAVLPVEPGGLRVWWRAVSQIPQFFRYLGIMVSLGIKARDPAKLDAMEAELYRRVNPKAWALYPGYVLPAAPPLTGRALPAAGDCAT